MDDLIAEFVSEAREMLQALECELVAWERDPADRARLDAIFRFVHTVKGNCGFFDMPRLQALAHAAEDALGEVRSGTRQANPALVDAILAVIDRIGEMVDQIAAGEDISAGSDEALVAALAEIPAEQIEPAAPAPEVAKSNRSTEVARTVRLPTELVDRVMSGVSDMILARNELERQLHEADANIGVESAFGRLTAILSDLQQAMTRARMQPIGTLFTGYQRLVRDLGAELGKRVEIEIESGQVELDREMIELIRDPLLHIVRNAVDHGIEPPAERIKSGKPEAGRLTFSARQTGNEIRIAISDDGRGIDSASFVEKAIKRGLITSEQAERMSDRQRNALICEPGLSTARKVTHLSGRGVGMDVVRASIERLGGKLKIDSTPGQGCRFILDVPLTLSIVPSITVRVGEQVFAIPRSYVDEIVRNSAQTEAEPIGGVRHVIVRDELRPCIALGEVLDLTGAVAANDQTLVMIRMIDGSVFALGVDGIVDHGDLVVRPVSPHVVRTNLYVGVAQLNDGAPALMMDIAGLATEAGLMVEGHGRSALVADDQSDTENSAELAPVIVFNGLDGIRKAVPIAAVERLFEVAVADIGRGGDGPHVVYEGRIFPLAGLAGDVPDAETLDVLLLQGNGRQVALATDGRVDAAEIDLATASGNLAMLDGATVELVDLARLQAPASPELSCRLPGDDPWCREFLRPLVSAAGYRVVEDQTAPVDLEITLDQGTEDLLVIATDWDGPQPIRRDDHAALEAALRSMQMRRLA